MFIIKNTKIGIFSLIVISNFCTASINQNLNTSTMASVAKNKNSNAYDHKAYQAKLAQQQAMALSERGNQEYRNKMDQLNALIHQIWPQTNDRSPIDLMITCPDYDEDMIMFIVSMIPGTTQLQTQSLKIGHEKRTKANLGMALLKANTGYRIYITPASKVQEAIDYLTAYKQGIRYNAFHKNFINPLSGNQMLFVASFNPELGTRSLDKNGDEIIHIALPEYQQDLILPNFNAPKITDPNFIFGR